MSKVLFAGSFNPYTIGHHSVFNNACNIFSGDNVHIAITQNPSKTGLNPHITKWITNAGFPEFSSCNVKVVDEPLLVDYATKHGYKCLVRSFRNSIDIDEETALATWNHSLSGIPTVFVPTDKCLEHISSSAIRGIEALGRNMSDYMVNQIQYERWKTKKPKRIIVTGLIGSGKSSFMKDYSDSFKIHIRGNTETQIRQLELVDMDQIVKNAMTDETAKTMRNFFDDTPVVNIPTDWWSPYDELKNAKDEVEDIIHNEMDWGYARGVYEISAFSAYDLDRYYSDSIIVYVSNYNNGKKRDIDNLFMAKVSQLQEIPKVVDFVIDKSKGNVTEVVQQIMKTMDTNGN